MSKKRKWKLVQIDTCGLTDLFRELSKPMNQCTHGCVFMFVIERMVENGEWIPWQTRMASSVRDVLDELAATYPPEALESVRVRKP